MIEVFPIGSHVRVINDSPWQGLRGTILTLHMLAAPLDDPLCFYLVALEGTRIKEPMWFEHDKVKLMTSRIVAFEA